MSDEPIACDAYDQLADAFAAVVETKPHNAFYDRPAMLALLPPLEGKAVLDAGCGPGMYAQAVVERGASVVGIDISARMVDHARKRLGDRATILEADLAEPLDFLPDDKFDVVVSALALDHVRDWARAFAEFYRVLRAPGHLVFSVGHPFDEFYDHHPEGNYFEIEQVAMTFNWQRFGVCVQMPYYRRPLSAMLEPLLAAGFRLERLVEPLPTAEFQHREPKDYAKLMRQPGFLCFRARKDLT